MRDPQISLVLPVTWWDNQALHAENLDYNACNYNKYFFPFCFFLFLSLSTSVACVLFWVGACMLLSYWLFVISLAFLGFFSLTSAFIGGECIAPGEEKFVLSKSVVHFSFKYSMLRGLVYHYLWAINFYIRSRRFIYIY